MVVDELYFVYFVFQVFVGQLFSYILADCSVRLVAPLNEVAGRLVTLLYHFLGYLPSYGIDGYVADALSLIPIYGLLHHADDIVVEASAQ